MSGKNRTSPEKIGPLVHPDMSGKYQTSPDLISARSHGTYTLNRDMQSRNIGIYRRYIPIPVGWWIMPSHSLCVSPILVRQLFMLLECLTACQLIKKKLLCYSQDNGLQLPNCRQKNISKGFITSVAVNYRYRRYKSIWKFQSIIDLDFSISIYRVSNLTLAIMSQQPPAVATWTPRYLNWVRARTKELWLVAVSAHANQTD